LIAKLIIRGATRNECLRRLNRALSEFVVEGVNTTLPLHNRILHEEEFRSGDYNIHWLERKLGLKPDPNAKKDKDSEAA